MVKGRKGYNSKKKGGLLVDDDLDFVSAFQKKTLTSVNYHGDVAGNAEEGMKAIEEERPGVILLNVMMEKDDAG